MATVRADFKQHPQVADLFGAALGRCENGVVILDRDERVVFWNNWIAGMSGVPVEAAQGRLLGEIFPDAKLDRIGRAVRMALDLRQASVLSRALNPRLLPLHQEGGEADAEAIEHQVIVKPLEARNGQFCLIQVFDVTDAVHRERFLKKQAVDLQRLADELAANERTLHGTLEASPVGVAIIAFGGTIRFANSRLATLFLTSSSSLVGRNAAELFTEPRDLLARLGRSGTSTEVCFRRHDGSELWAQVTSEPTTFEQEPAILCWLYDISAHKQAEHILAAERDRAAELARARTEFLAMVSHEIRTPLNGIMGTARMLDETPLDAHQRELVETIAYPGDSLLTILNDVIDLSKFESGKIKLETSDIDVERLVENLTMLMAPRAAEKDIGLDAEVAEGLHRVIVADAGRLRQVLLNLIGNAIKFTDHGSVTVRVEQLDDAGRAVRMRFSIVDTGIGIPPASRSQLFTEFYQVDPAVARRQGGTGLGLAISKRIVEAMGGAIGVESAEGQGSTFWFTLPFPKGDPRRLERRASGAAARAAAQPGRLLLVEDNEINRKVAVSMLVRDGHEVAVATTGLEAIARTVELRPDLILMDVQLPELDGHEATRRIRRMDDKALASTPIIALTANAMPDDAARCIEAGMNEVLTKPIVPERLARAVEVALATSRARPEAARATPAQRELGMEDDVLRAIEATIGAAKVDELIELFNSTGRETIDAIAEAAAAGDVAEIGALAHRLKGGALNLGFVSVGDAAAALEAACREGRAMSELERRINRLAEAYGQTAEMLARRAHESGSAGRAVPPA